MRIPLFLSTLSFALLVACKASVPADAATPAAVAPAPTQVTPVAATPAAPTAPQAPAIDQGFTKSMAYADLRRQVLAAGWLPRVDPACAENIGGRAPICFELPELEVCSADGHCNLRFADAASGRELTVHTYGPRDRWDTPGEESMFAVTAWDFAPVATTEAGRIACPSKEFDAFLKAFASDPKVAKGYTAPLVRVADLYSDDDGDHVRNVYWTGDAYREFNLAYTDGAFHYIDAAGKVDPIALKVEIQTENDGARIVRYGYGMSEGNAYRFRERSDCWYLTEDPQAPSP